MNIKPAMLFGKTGRHDKETTGLKDVPAKTDSLEAHVIAALRTVFDPEIPVNIYDLGLIYHIAIDEKSVVNIDMTLTAPGCPVAGSLPRQVESAAAAVAGVSAAHVTLVWDPPWSNDMMSEDARLVLGMFE